MFSAVYGWLREETWDGHNCSFNIRNASIIAHCNNPMIYWYIFVPSESNNSVPSSQEDHPFQVASELLRWLYIHIVAHDSQNEPFNVFAGCHKKSTILISKEVNHKWNLIDPVPFSLHPCWVLIHARLCVFLRKCNVSYIHCHILIDLHHSL